MADFETLVIQILGRLDVKLSDLQDSQEELREVVNDQMHGFEILLNQKADKVDVQAAEQHVVKELEKKANKSDLPFPTIERFIDSWPKRITALAAAGLVIAPLVVAYWDNTVGKFFEWVT